MRDGQRASGSPTQEYVELHENLFDVLFEFAGVLETATNDGPPSQVIVRSRMQYSWYKMVNAQG